MSDGVTISLHYSRPSLSLSSRSKTAFVPPLVRPPAAACAAACLLASLAAWSQYPGQVTKKTSQTPDLRAVAVLEWTGEPGKPKTCRIVPVTVYDGERLQDGGVYLARPQPLALTSEVEYELTKNGKKIGLFEVKTAGQEQGSWVGHGDWKPLPKPKAVAAKPALIDAGDDEYSDKPVLHRKHHAEDSPSKAGGDDKEPAAPSAPSDPDRPTLHKHDSKDSSAEASAPDDPDRPTLHKKTDSASDSDTAGSAPSDPDRPTIKKAKQKPAEDIGHVDSVAESSDPDRPLLKRGKSSGSGADIPPTLMGLPPDMQQAVAVSDAKNRPEHPFTYSWANPDDEGKMKSQLEDMARDALGLSTPPPAPKPAPRRPTATAGTARRTPKPAPPPPPAPPVPLEDEQFRVYELAYGSGATLVLTAHTAGARAEEKFVTLVAQPDLYGNVRVLLKSVTDGAHLDQTPRMRLVDAVDAQADNRGELLFELRGDGSRQFALYRIMRGTAEKLFVSGGGFYGSASSE